MPGGLPFGLEVCNAQTNSVVVNPSATANTKGSFVELITSTASDTCWALATLDHYPEVATTCSIDFAIGSAGSEKIFASDLMSQCVKGGDNFQGACTFSFPIHIPAGSRIAVRSQTNGTAPSGGDTVASIHLFDGAFTQVEGAAGVDAIGFNSGTTFGTTIDPGAVAGTKGSYAQLTAATSRDYIGFFGYLHIPYSYSAIFAGVSTVDIAIGGAGSEQIIVPSYRAEKNQTLLIPNGVIPFVPIQIPSGTRIAARAASGDTNATTRVIGLTLYGVYL